MKSVRFICGVFLLACIVACNGESGVSDAKQRSSSQERVIKRNPNPKEGYRLIMTINDPPGEFRQSQGNIQFEIKNDQQCGKVLKFAGVVVANGEYPRVRLNKVSDGRFESEAFHLDMLIDEDYYGRGICNWEFTGASGGVRATGNKEDTLFWLSLKSDQVRSGETVKRYYWKGYYPRSKNGRFPASGELTPKKYGKDYRDQLFTISLRTEPVEERE